MSATIRNEFGQIVIDEKVIATVAAMSAQESYGLVGLVAQNTKDGLFELLRFENKTKGVEVIVNGDIVDINLTIMVEFGVRIAVVCENIISKVKYNIENNTHLKVNSVNVIVQGIRV